MYKYLAIKTFKDFVFSNPHFPNEDFYQERLNQKLKWQLVLREIASFNYLQLHLIIQSYTMHVSVLYNY